MLISKNWLQDFVKISNSLSAEELALKLTMSTVEVEGFEAQGEGLKDIVLGKVESVEHHPNADKLKICTVDFGEKHPAQVVCGGSNVKTGMLCAFAGLGAKVRWHGQGELVELKKAKIRGADSYGMICAADEIGLDSMFPKKDEMEILDLGQIINQKSKIINDFIGKPLSEVFDLDDVVFDIDNKSMTHRPDLWGHYGLSREVAAILGEKLKEYKVASIKEGKDNKIEIKIEEKDLCHRYMSVAIDGVEVGPSPDWMQKRLLAVGLRPINNLVDITNYVMYELGQPMHAMDGAKLNFKNNKLTFVVRRAKKGEKFETLDDKEHTLDESVLLVGDGEKAVDIAGVMGGKNCEVTVETKMLVFEVANFDATSIRRTATKYGLRTDASARFEKSQDPYNVELALKKGVELVLQMCPNAKVISNVADEGSFKLNQGPIEVSAEFLQNKIGMEIDKKQVMDILERLGFEVKEKRGVYHVTIPTWRATKDISIPEDIVEEVARMYGYDNILPTLPTFPIVPPQRNELRMLERKIKELLAYEFGFTESYNYSFVGPDWLEKLGIKTDKHVELDNPIAKDRPFLRRSLIPNLLENAESNLHRFETVKLFEIGKIFIQEEKGDKVKPESNEFLPKQDVMMSLVFSAKSYDKPFYEVSSTVTDIFNTLGLSAEITSQNLNLPFTHPGRSAVIKVENAEVGIVAELHPQTQETTGIPYRLATAEINLNKLLPFLSEKSSYNPLSAYPAVERDIAFVVDKNIEHAAIIFALKGVDGLIESVELFDVFEGRNVETGKKSMAYHIVYRASDRTLESEEVDGVHAKVEGVLEKEFGAEVRK